MRGNLWPPMSSVSNATNVSAGNAKLSSNCAHVCIGLLQKFFDLVNLLNRKFSVSCSRASWANNQLVLPSVAHVVQLSNPLKVFHTVVGFNAVLVVDLRQVVGVVHEVQGNKPMSQNIPWFVGYAVSKHINVIAELVNVWLEQLGFLAKLPAAQGTRQYLPRGANLVKPFVPFNIFPDFSVHSSNLGLLSAKSTLI